MDVADSAFDFLEQNKDKADIDDRLLNKKTWRDWMNIFTDGKKVSEANLVITEEVDLTQQIDVESNPLA